MLLELRTLILATGSMALFCLCLWSFARVQTRKVVATLHQLGKMGSREIARTPKALVRLLLTAGGAGLITAGTVSMKFMIYHGSYSSIGTGALTALNFIFSFLFMQALGFRLATKQSPLLGAALGKKWKELQTLLRPFNPQLNAHLNFMKNWKQEAGFSFQTQLASAAGNLLFVIPSSVFLHWIYQKATGVPFLDNHSARVALESLSPWTAGTLSYAAFTGCLLWICAFIGGLIANRFSVFSKATATTVFNIGLGFLLALVPLLGKRWGIPLDVRHFTLSGGTAALAVASLGWSAAWAAGLSASLLGVLLIGVLNFSVSFALAFTASLLTENDGPENFRPRPPAEPFLHWVSPYAQSAASALVSTG